MRAETLVTKASPPPAEIISQRTEDALSVRTLGDLARSANPDVRHAAVRILAERVTRSSGAAPALVRAVRGRDGPAARARALAVLRFLAQGPARDALAAPGLLEALVERAVALLPAARLRAARVPVGPDGRRGGGGAGEDDAGQHRLRGRAERDALWVLAQAVRQRPVGAALAAGLVRRWLRRYPFGGRAGVGALVERRGGDDALGGGGGGSHGLGDIGGGGIWARTSLQVRRRAVARLRAEQTDDEALARLLQWLAEDADGRAELRRYGLLGWAPEGEDEWSEEELEKAMLGELQRRIRGGRGGGPGDEDEAELRRRRRQAMVLGEGGVPISVDNIFEV